MTAKSKSGNPRLGREALLDFAGEVYFARGEDYYQRGKVERLEERDGSILGQVSGTRKYQVTLKAGDDGGVTWSCSCPLGDRGDFCKHAVAVGLSWLARNQPDDSASSSDQPPDEDEVIRLYLEQLPREVLVRLIMDQTFEDDRLHRQLALKAHRDQKTGVDLAAFKRQLRSAVGVRRFVDYRGMPSYVRGIDDVVAALEEVFTEGHAQEAMELCEYGLRLVEKALNRVDDSDGMLGDILRQLEDLHLKACLQCRPDPVKLAQKLFSWEMASDWDTFSDAVTNYRDVLGDDGIARYYQKAREAWDTLPKLGKGDESKAFEGKRFRLTRIMEALAKEAGDLEELVQVKSKDLSSPHSYLDIAKIYMDADLAETALKWAEDGYRHFKGEPRVGILAEFLVPEYGRLGRHDDAIPLAWDVFAAQPSKSNYQRLHKAADPAGQWESWREKALEHARAHCSRQTGPWARGRSVLVEIFLWEGDALAALEEARDGSCTQGLWLDLASALQDEHPGQAAKIYSSMVATTIKRGNNKAYAEALEYMKKVEILLAKSGRQQDFADFVATIRKNFKIKRNMMKLIDGQGW